MDDIWVFLLLDAKDFAVAIITGLVTFFLNIPTLYYMIKAKFYSLREEKLKNRSEIRASELRIQEQTQTVEFRLQEQITNLSVKFAVLEENLKNFIAQNEPTSEKFAQFTMELHELKGKIEILTQVLQGK